MSDIRLTAKTAGLTVAGSTDLGTTVAAAGTAIGWTFRRINLFDTAPADWATWEIAGDLSANGVLTWLASNPGNMLVLSMDLIPVAAGGNSNTLAWVTAGAAGNYNAHAATLAGYLVANGCGNAIIRLGTECNGNWENDYIGDTLQERQLWAQTFAQEVTAMRAVSGANFLFCWNVNAAVTNYPLWDYYPGDAYVDIIGIDQYDAFVGPGTPTTASPATTAALFAQQGGTNDIIAFAQGRGKPLAFPEWGGSTITGGYPGGFGDDPYYVQGMAALIKANQFAYHAYYDTNNDTVSPLTSAYPLTLAAFQAAFAPPPAGTVALAAAAGAALQPRVVVTVPGHPQVLEDPSSPPPAMNPSSACIVTTAAFSPPANSLVLVLARGYSNGNSSTAADSWTVSDSVTGAWAAGTHVGVLADTIDGSCASLLVAEKYFSSAESGMTVSVSNSDPAGGSGGYGFLMGLLTVRVLTGAAASQSGAATASGILNAHASTQRYGTLTTTAAGSLVYMTCGDNSGDLAGTYTPVAGSAGLYDPPLFGGVSVYGGMARTAAVTGTPGAVNVGWATAAPSPGGCAFAWLAVEVLPAASVARSYFPSAGISLSNGAYTSGGKLILPCVSIYSLSESGSICNLTGSAVDIRVDGVPPLGTGTTEAQFLVRYDASNYFMIWYGDGSAGLTCRLRQAGTNTDHLFVTTYSGTTHKYWRVREASGTVYFGTSPDRTTWTEYSAAHTLAAKIQTMRMYLSVGYYGTETSPGPMTIGAVNSA